MFFKDVFLHAAVCGKMPLARVRQGHSRPLHPFVMLLL